MTFRILEKSETQKAYDLLCVRVRDLIAKGTGQYVRPFPDFEVYEDRTRRGSNWVLTEEDVFLGIVSIEMDGLPEEAIAQIEL